MAETMTYDPGTDTVTTENNLTEAEKESLVVGEEMENQQEQLLAGKYKNAQELERAYGELQKKLGEVESTDEVDTEAETEAEDGPTDYSEGAQLINEASEEYWKNGEELSPETIEKFSGMSSQDLVSAYMEYSKANPAQAAEVADLTESDANSIKNSVGGEAQYNQMTSWAADNLDQGVIEAFDTLLDSGNAGAIQLAVNGLKAQYENATGYEGRMYTGKAPKSSGDVFRSQPELVAAMNDPRYDQDPAYRQDVIEKLDRSDLAF